MDVESSDSEEYQVLEIARRISSYPTFFLSLLTLTCLIAASPLSAGAVLSGIVVDEPGSGVGNVDLDVIDQCTGENLFLVNDRTAADGTYAIVVPTGTHDVLYTPPAGSTLAGNAQRGIVVTGDVDLGTTVLHPGLVVSGVVVDTTGSGIGGVDLQFIDASTGDRIFVSNRTTDVTGAYSVRIAAGTYDVQYRPPATTIFTTGVRSGLVVQTDVTGLSDTLVEGLQISGFVIEDATGLPVRNVDLDAIDLCTGLKVVTSHDNTDINGAFSIFVPQGTYLIKFDPPKCSTLAAERRSGVVVDRDTDLGDIKLLEGVPVSGRVLDLDGIPVGRAQLKFYTAGGGGRRQAAARDHTAADGTFEIRVPVETYNINIEPPRALDLLLERLSGIDITGPTDLGDITLSSGFPVSGRLVDGDGIGVENVNINAVDSASRTALRLANDSSLADGSFRVIVPAGTYDFQYKPPACSGLAPDSQDDISVSGPTTLPDKTLVVGVHATGRIVDQSAVGVANVDLDFFIAGTGKKIYTPNDTSDSVGDYDVLLPPETYDIDYIPAAGVPLRPAHRLGETFLTDRTLSDTVLPPGVLVSGTVVDSRDLTPVPGTRIEFYVPSADTAEFTPHNQTHADGSYTVSIDAGTWDLLYTPPPGDLAPRWRRGILANADVTLPETQLLPLTVPSVTSITPNAGSTAGGQAITIAGIGFQPDAVALIGDVTARGLIVVSSTEIMATTPPHPAGLYDVAVVNPGNQVGVLAAAYSFDEPALPVSLTVSRSASDTVLTWTATGQADYTVFRNTAPQGFDDSSILDTLPGLEYTDIGAADGSEAFFYLVE